MKAKIVKGKFSPTVVKVKFELEFDVDPNVELTKEDVLDMIDEEDRGNLGELVLNHLNDAEVLLEEPETQESGTVDISSIMRDSMERSFLRWLLEHEISWQQRSSDLNYIHLWNKGDLDKIVKDWPEVKLIN